MAKTKPVTKSVPKKKTAEKTETETAQARVDGAVPGEVKAPERPLKPSWCRAYMRKRLAQAFPAIVNGFVKEAETGSCAHVKLASELLEKTPVKRVSRRKGPAERMVEELRSQTVEGRQ